MPSRKFFPVREVVMMMMMMIVMMMMMTTMMMLQVRQKLVKGQKKTMMKRE